MTEISSGNNLISVNLNGTAQGCGRNITGLRYAFNNLDKTAIALKQYQSAFNRTDLNPIPTAQSFNENPFTTEIAFSCSYDNSNLPSVWFDYQVSLNVGTNGLISADIVGTIYARGGDVASKLARAKIYAAGINLYYLVLPFYNSFDVSSSTPLNPVPIANGQTDNETDGTVNLNASFNNRDLVNSLFEQFNATINITPSLAQVDAKPVLNGAGTWSVVNLDYGSRASLSINGTAIINRNVLAVAGEVAVRQACYSLFNQYGRSINVSLDQNNVTVSRTDDRLIAFNFAWSFGPINIVGPSSVSSLSV